MESQYLIKYGRLLNLSEPALINCDTRDWGCGGGNPYNAFLWIKKNNIPEAKYYPTAPNGKCLYNKTSMPGVGCKGYDLTNVVLNGNETKLRLLVNSTGPISATFQVTPNFISYKSGIFFDNSCGPGFNHLFIVVGYGTSPEGIDYW